MSKTTDNSEYTSRLREQSLTYSNQPSLYTSSYQKYVQPRTKTVGDNPQNYRYLIANGLDATTSFSGVETKIQFGRRQVKSYIANYSGGVLTAWERARYEEIFPPQIVLGGGDPSLLDSSSTFAKALGKFNQKTHAVSTKFQGGAFLGELRETIHSIRHPANALATSMSSYFRVAKKLRSTVVKTVDHYGSLKHRKVRSAIKNANRAIAGSWLEYSFGWMPLLHDINDAMEAASDRYKVKPPFEYVKATVSDKDMVSSSVFTNVVGPVSWANYVDVVSQMDVTFRGVVSIQTNSPNVNRDLWGFSPRDFVPTIWEVCPYSWLVDYFSNVQDVINGLSFGGHNVRWSNVTVRKLYETRNWATLLSITPSIPGTIVYDGQILGGLTRSWRKVTSRTRYMGSYIPGLIFTVPVSTKKLSNVVAVATQLLGRFL